MYVMKLSRELRLKALESSLMLHPTGVMNCYPFLLQLLQLTAVSLLIYHTYVLTVTLNIVDAINLNVSLPITIGNVPFRGVESA